MVVSMKKRRGLSFAVKFVLILFGVLSCLLAVLFLSKTVHFPEKGKPEETLRIGNNGLNSVLNIIAEKQGFFAAEGIDPVMTEAKSGPLGLQALEANAVDVQTASDFAGINAFATDPTLRILTQTTRHFGFELIGRADSGIESPNDLVGKKIGFVPETPGQYYLSHFLILHDIDEAEVELIPLVNSAELVAKLKSSEVDAVVQGEPFVGATVEAVGGKAIQWKIQGDYAAFGLVWARADFIQSHEELLGNYLLALFRAETFVQQHPEEARRIVAKDLGREPEVVDLLWSKYQFSVLLSQELVVDLEDQRNWLVRRGANQNEFPENTLNIFSFDPMMRVLADRVEIYH